MAIVRMDNVGIVVDDLDETIARLRPLGGEVLDDVVDYRGLVRLCYFRGPGGIVIGLAEDAS
jgi:predicted enzyme related to lactoylglutathione lyase